MLSSGSHLHNGHSSQNFPKNILLKIDEAAKIIRKSTEDYGADQIFISFNGGKDCTALLHLYMQYSRHDEKPIVIYIQPENPFKEVDDFVRLCEKIYDIEIRFVSGKLKTTLEQLCSEHPNLEAVMMGCRRTDPYCENLKTYQKTDPGWPNLIRINPLLDWDYKDIWDYIRLNKIEYCKLYDEGYTSIGDRENTKPNQSLLVGNGNKETKYRPAWELQDNSLERSGRF